MFGVPTTLSTLQLQLLPLYPDRSSSSLLLATVLEHASSSSKLSTMWMVMSHQTQWKLLEVSLCHKLEASTWYHSAHTQHVAAVCMRKIGCPLNAYN